MHHGVGPHRSHGVQERRAVQRVGDHQARAGTLNHLGPCPAPGQPDDLMPGLEEQGNQLTSDDPGRARDKNSHFNLQHSRFPKTDGICGGV